MGFAAINKNIELPEQGKFNAAEKINFMTLMGNVRELKDDYKDAMRRLDRLTG